MCQIYFCEWWTILPAASRMWCSLHFLYKRESSSKHGCLRLQRREVDFMELWELREEFLCVPIKDGSAGEMRSYFCSGTELFLRLVSRDLYWCCWQYHVLVTVQWFWSLYKACRLTGWSAVWTFHCIHVALITCTVWTVYILYFMQDNMAWHDVLCPSQLS